MSWVFMWLTSLVHHLAWETIAKSTDTDMNQHKEGKPKRRVLSRKWPWILGWRNAVHPGAGTQVTSPKTFWKITFDTLLGLVIMTGVLPQVLTQLSQAVMITDALLRYSHSRWGLSVFHNYDRPRYSHSCWGLSVFRNYDRRLTEVFTQLLGAISFS